MTARRPLRGVSSSGISVLADGVVACEMGVRSGEDEVCAGDADGCTWGAPAYVQMQGPPSEHPEQQKSSPFTENGAHSNSAKQFAQV